MDGGRSIRRIANFIISHRMTPSARKQSPPPPLKSNTTIARSNTNGWIAFQRVKCIEISFQRMMMMMMTNLHRASLYRICNLSINDLVGMTKRFAKAPCNQNTSQRHEARESAQRTKQNILPVAQ